jgi:hypothetical protein
MSSFRLRPRFQHITYSTLAEIEQLVKNELDLENIKCDLRIISGHIQMRIPKGERHFWSPQLDLSIEEEDEKTLIRGFYGPNPNTWALFTYGYVILGILFTFTSMWVLSKWTLDKAAPESWLLLIFALLALSLYLIAQFGQKIGAEQMYELHFFYQRVIGEKIKIE